MLKFLLTFLGALIMIGCGPRYVDFYPCHDDGTTKPSVVLLPVIIGDEQAQIAVQEIEQVVRHQALCNGQLYLFGDDELQKRVETFQHIDFLSNEDQLVDVFNNADFVVISELTDHQFFPYGQGLQPANTSIIAYPCNHLLVLKMRLKIVDVRRRCPKTILQEVFTRGYYVPNSAPGADCLQKAYYRFGASLNQRLEEVIQSHR